MGRELKRMAGAEFGRALEHLVVMEVMAHRAYAGLDYSVCYWRSKGGQEIDLILGDADVAIEVTSHFHFFEANRRLSFDRRAAFGMRLDLPAGTSVRWEPGESLEVALIPFGGSREAWGFGGLVDGPLDTADAQAILGRLEERHHLQAKLQNECETHWWALKK